ncbi:hypothetical protein [Winogradskyella forsetii]|uniref:hypothetical protein n=1 Tax=Winogradskyella forsetii TaxID=2686077 RepID=UPI0015B8258C|nr:hypothetical protein [Winogradskyella forsetii]
MRINFIILLFIFAFPSAIIAQSNSEMGAYYLMRSEALFFNKEINRSLELFNKSLEYMDSIPNSRVAKLGMLLNFEHKKCFEASSYGKSYFEFEKDKSTEEYQYMLKTYDYILKELGTDMEEPARYIEAPINNIQEPFMDNEELDKNTEEFGNSIDELDKGIEELVRDIEELDHNIEKLGRDNEEHKVLMTSIFNEEIVDKRFDSLNNKWINLSRRYEVHIDSIYEFNKYKLAVFSKNNQLGIMDDTGNIIEKPQSYNHFLTYDGYALMLDKQDHPTKIYVYNFKTRQGFVLPEISTFNSNSLHYGKVMLPRANGLIVTYPDNSNNAYVFNVKSKLFVTSDTEREHFLRKLKKNDIIETYKAEQVRVKGRWLTIGSELGAGVYELHEFGNRYGYLNTLDGKVWNEKYYNYLGGFCNGNFELIEGEKRFWMDVDGLKSETNEDENGTYSGDSRFVKREDGIYVIIQNREGKDYLIYGDEALLNQEQFIEAASR